MQKVPWCQSDEARKPVHKRVVHDISDHSLEDDDEVPGEDQESPSLSKPFLPRMATNKDSEHVEESGWQRIWK